MATDFTTYEGTLQTHFREMFAKSQESKNLLARINTMPSYKIVSQDVIDNCNCTNGMMTSETFDAMDAELLADITTWQASNN